MKWVVGLDLARGSAGALRFAKWVREQAKDEVMGLHALQVPAVAAPEWTDAVGEKIRQLLGDMARETGMEDLFIDVAESPDAAETLEEVRARTKFDAIVVGRRARADELALVRLGRVARYAARGAKSPVVICPPELDMGPLDGPVLLATDGTQRTGGTARKFAADLAKAWGRPLVAVHVAEDVDEYTATAYLNPEALTRARTAMRDEGQRLLTAWAGEAGAPAPDETVLRQGDRVPTLLFEANERRACMLVVGSRKLEGVERWLSSSLGLGLAARSRCPVAIVPPKA